MCLPGHLGINFTKQYGQSGLDQGNLLYSASSIDESSPRATAMSRRHIPVHLLEFRHQRSGEQTTDAFRTLQLPADLYLSLRVDAAQMLNSALTAVKGNLRQAGTHRSN